MDNSILDDIKKLLNIPVDYLVFDQDIIIHINSVFSTLKQLGIGPSDGFEITGDDEVWSEFIGTDKRYSAVRTYIYLRVRLLFDPPNTSYLLQAQSEQIKELEWRLNTDREDTDWVNPDPPVIDPDDEEIIFDGGGA